MPSWADGIFGKDVYVNGTLVSPRRGRINVVAPGATGADNPATDSTDVDLTAALAANFTPWTTFTPWIETSNDDATVDSADVTAVYQRVGASVHLVVQIVGGSNDFGTGDIVLTIPGDYWIDNAITPAPLGHAVMHDGASHAGSSFEVTLDAALQFVTLDRTGLESAILLSDISGADKVILDLTIPILDQTLAAPQLQVSDAPNGAPITSGQEPLDVFPEVVIPDDGIATTAVDLLQLPTVGLFSLDLDGGVWEANGGAGITGLTEGQHHFRARRTTASGVRWGDVWTVTVDPPA